MDSVTPFEGAARRPAHAFLFSFLLVLSCGGCRRADNNGQPRPVAECEEYEQRVARCTGRHMAIATQPAALASTDEQRERLKKLCLVNIERLNQSCR
jgi:hypothetical protein